MSAEARSIGRTALRHTPEPAGAWVLTSTLVASLAFVLVLVGDDLASTVAEQWPNILFWMALVLVVNLWPLTVGELTLTLDMPMLLAIALLYSPPVAALVAIVAAVDIREVGGRVPLVRAIYNRAQVGYCVLTASWVFHELSSLSEPPGRRLVATLLAVLAFNAVNVGLVAIYLWLRIHSWNRFTVGDVTQFVITYAGYGVIALVLAHLHQEVGAWSVLTFLVPIAVARQALLRSQHLQAVTNRLLSRERLLDRLFDRISDERRDERMRIASSLHDDVLQSLIRISQLGDFIRGGVADGSQVSRDALEISSLAHQTVSDLREVMSDLRKSPLGRGGLTPTLEGLARDLQLDWRTPIRLRSFINDQTIDPERQMVLYQVAKEALLNALKHADPTSIVIEMRNEGSNGVTLEVFNDGEAFDPERVDRSRHFGLGLMEERVRLAGGHLSIQSQEESGTRLSVFIPTENESG